VLFVWLAFFFLKWFWWFCDAVLAVPSAAGKRVEHYWLCRPKTDWMTSSWFDIFRRSHKSVMAAYVAWRWSWSITVTLGLKYARPNSIGGALLFDLNQSADLNTFIWWVDIEKGLSVHPRQLKNLSFLCERHGDPHTLTFVRPTVRPFFSIY